MEEGINSLTIELPFLDLLLLTGINSVLSEVTKSILNMFMVYVNNVLIVYFVMYKLYKEVPTCL